MDVCFENLMERLDETMKEEEKSERTREKYRRDVRSYLRIACDACKHRDGKNGSCFSREVLAVWRGRLSTQCCAASANSRIAAVNYWLRSCGKEELRIRHFRVQQSAFRAAERELTKEEYYRLLKEARAKENLRLYMIMQTIAATGLRVSELSFVTVESIQTGRAWVTLKGKTRVVLLTTKLCQRLGEYAKQNDIRTGSLFVTRSGRPVDRSNIVHEMKRLGAGAGIRKEKIFPHNLRHLFAVTYYRQEHDLLHLADLLGHANVNTTRIYTSMGEQEYAQQIETLELVE